MINDLGLLEIAQKAAQMEGVEALHIAITSDGVIALSAYSQPRDYSEKGCMCSDLHLFKDESAKYNEININVFFKTIESWKKKN
jgi:hypothetical protein